ncbi:MAG: 16S rRNA (uracil(1498)-N(3))-methyltransferase, partial [Kiritimatiellaeota bacterium]|nr:16S rRNA (uracil(1498)-N(3))-methyltransferase [Kiritimatiellota bacterium]
MPAPVIEGGAAHHLRTVLRVKAGEALTLLDGEGRRREVRVTDVARHCVATEGAGEVEAVPPETPRLRLFQCIAKGTRMEWLVEKAAELGVAELVPVLSRRVVIRLAEGESVERWQRIADGALEQSGGAWRMRVAPVISFERALADGMGQHPFSLSAFQPSVKLYGSLSPGARPLGDCLPPSPPLSIDWWVGPEGDFTPDEEAALAASGALPVSLGTRILRTETAALAGIILLRSDMNWRASVLASRTTNSCCAARGDEKPSM